MGLIGRLRRIARKACPDCRFAYDVQSLVNVRADDRRFPLIWVDEYYSGRIIRGFTWRREVTMEIHFLGLADMQDDGRENDRVRERLLPKVQAFIEELNRDTAFTQVSEYQCDPEPPMFDATAIGWLVRVTFAYNLCERFEDNDEGDEGTDI